MTGDPARDRRIAEFRAEREKTVGKHGFDFQSVFPVSEDGYWFVYTIAMSTRLGYELVMTGLSDEAPAIMLKLVEAVETGGLDLDSADSFSIAADDGLVKLQLRPVPEWWARENTGQNADFVLELPKSIQIVWPLDDGTFPDDDDAPSSFTHQQPIFDMYENDEDLRAR